MSSHWKYPKPELMKSLPRSLDDVPAAASVASSMAETAKVLVIEPVEERTNDVPNASRPGRGRERIEK